MAALSFLAIPSSGQESRVVVPVTINEVPKGDMLIAVRGDDVFVRASDLQQAGMSGAMWNRVVNVSRLPSRLQLQGEETIALRLFAPLLQSKFDEAALTLTVIADPRLFGETAVDLQVRKPANLTYSKATSTFLNYAVSSRGVGDVGFSGETGTSVRGNLVYNSFFRPAHGKFIRSLSDYVIDDTTRLRRWTFGDAIATTDTLGGAATLGGVTVSRNFNLDPYFIRYPSYGLAGTASTPSTVDVYVNGILVQRRDVPPGPFDLRNIPVSAGSGTARVVIRDAYGNEHVQSSSFYYSTAVLGRGTSEFSYSMGALRKNFSTASFDYGDPALLAFHRVGITDALTLGGRFEASRGLFSGGGTASMRTRIGDMEGAAAVSHHNSKTGSAVSGTYRYLGRRFGYGATLRTFSRSYANLSVVQQPENLRILRDGNAFVSLLVPRGSFSLQWNTLRFPNAPADDHLALLTSVSISRATFFFSIGQANQAGRRHSEYFAGVGIYGPHMTTANLSVSGGGGGTLQQSVEIQRSLPVGTGFGYRLLSRTAGGNRNGNAVLQYNAPFGQYDIGLDPYHTNSKPTINASGGFVYEKGAFEFTRAVQQSFALVRVPGVPNVRVYLSNQLIGRTDADGDLLVPNLLSYYGNNIRIDDRDIPLDYDVREIEETIAPPYRGGAFVEFPVQRVRTIVGSIVMRAPEGEVVPAFGELNITDRLKTYTSPLGRQGELYLENVPPGTFNGMVEFSGGACNVTIVVPPTSGNIVKLGRLPCTPTRKTP
ncbi:MAG TPA: fimbria/pilus outer membrane usher protein [Thermoanaerobaculia bacterium]|nr:fimbria/pilus outer membrane usher protein [Thermoanaerobaculia bacterium]